MRAAARQIARTVTHVDALLNIAAIYTSEYEQSDDGFELMLATNHLAPFLLTNLLRDRLAGAGRVITVSAPSSTRVDVDQLLSKDHFRSLRTFGATKAANLMFTFELARRAKRWDVGAYAYHPGLVRSELMREAPRPIRVLTRLVSRPPNRAAEDLADLATSPAFASTTGWFFKGGRRIFGRDDHVDMGLRRSILPVHDDARFKPCLLRSEGKEWLTLSRHVLAQATHGAVAAVRRAGRAGGRGLLIRPSPLHTAFTTSRKDE